jgi:hypothetical protein
VHKSDILIKPQNKIKLEIKVFPVCNISFCQGLANFGHKLNMKVRKEEKKRRKKEKKKKTSLVHINFLAYLHE